MQRPFTRALAVCALAAAAAAPAVAAGDLTGQTIEVDTIFPTAADLYASDQVVVGSGVEISCAGGYAGPGVCLGFNDAAHFDFGAQTLTLVIDAGSYAWSSSDFNGYEFKNLSAGGAWTGYTLDTTFAGLDASRISFTPDTIMVNMEGLDAEPGKSFTFTLIPAAAIPEPSETALLLAGLGALAIIVRRRRI